MASTPNGSALQAFTHGGSVKPFRSRGLSLRTPMTASATARPAKSKRRSHSATPSNTESANDSPK